MDVQSTVRHSTWRAKPFGRRVLRTEPPYFSISPSAEENHDAVRREVLTRLASGHS
jgi:hypothetical protein